MKNLRYITILFLWSISVPLLNAQNDYCSDTLYFCNYGTTILEGNGQLVGPFQLSTQFFYEIDHDFDGEDLHIYTSSSFFSFSFVDSIRVEDLGTGIVCHVPFVLENFASSVFDIPDIDCIESFFQDPSIDYQYTAYHGKKYNFCKGDKVTYRLQDDAFSYYAPIPPNDILTIDRITQTLGDIENIDSFSIDLVYNKTGYELLELTTYNPSGCAFTMYYPVEVIDTLPPTVLHDGSSTLPSFFCQGQQIDLSSHDGQNLKWTVSNGLQYNGSQFTFTLDVPGTYQIKVEKVGNCDCSQPAYFTIVIDEAIAPSIICTGTLCDGGEVTYYAGQECDSYEWSVENGTIVGGGGSEQDYATVLWTEASSGSITLGTPSCSSSMCQEVTIKEISIIDAEASIVGLDSICTGDVSYYSIPDYNGTTFSWKVSEGGYIQNGQSENNIAVKWSTGTERSKAIVSVQYENCDINCQGYSEKEITILPVFEIVLDQSEYCINGKIVLSNNLGDVVNYSIISPDGDTFVYNNVDTILFIPDITGVYGFIAENHQDGICNIEDQATTRVSFYPEPLAQLIGPRAVCKFQTTSYHADLLNNNETVFWEVFDGDLSMPLHTSTSLSLDYMWVSDGPYQVKTTVYNAYTNCSSQATIFELHSDHQITGVDSACVESSYWYEYNGKPVASEKWKITPDDAGVILFISGNKVKIHWQYAGNHNISIDQCDKITELNVYIEPEVILMHNAPEDICQSDSVLVSFSTNVPAEFNVIQKWSKDTVATNESPSAYLVSGEYNMYTTTAIGCVESEYIYIISRGKPSARFDIIGDASWCPPGSTRLKVKFYNSNYSYQWFRDGIPIPGQTGETLFTNKFGEYTLRVTNQYGCISISDARLLEECCNTTSAPINDNSVGIGQTMISCDTRSFEVLPTFYSSTFRWRASKFFSNYYMGIGTEVAYTFPEAGTYTIYATGDSLCQDVDIFICNEPATDEVCEGGRTTVTIPVVADFRTTQQCGSKKINFIDTSTKINGTTGLKYSWDFGEPESGNSNTSTSRNPNHTYDSIGLYTVHLIITHPSGCTTEKTKVVMVRDRPEVKILTNQNFCLDSHTLFSSSVESGSGLDYLWNFGDPSSGSNTSTQKNRYHKFSSAGTYTVSLRVKDPNNCVDNASITVTIAENDLSGEIISDKIYPKCPGEEVGLSAPTALYYNWSNGDSAQNIQVVEEGNYRVTITNEFGCRHITKYHFVDDYQLQSVGQIAILTNSFGSTSIKYDSIEICYGDRFDLQASFIPSSKYTWTNSNNQGNTLTYADDLSTLTPGRYEYYTTVEEIPSPFKIQAALIAAGYDLGPNGADGTLNVDTEQALADFQADNGLPLGILDNATFAALDILPCETQVGPFIVIIRALPENPIIDSDLATNCEGELSTMLVSNNNEDQEYKWSTGVEGLEIVAYAAGEYEVTTTDTFGCISTSKAIEIYEVPEVSAWMTGCREVCFPEEICINLQPENTYTIIKDGVEGNSLDVLSGNLALEGIGEYQLKATNSNGCIAVSDLLVLSKTPDVHDLSGIVYFDDNENGTYDLGDVLLEGVPVFLISPDSVVSETITNNEGFYEFVGFEEYDLRTIIDPSLVDYILTGSIDTALLYETCIEERQIDFPLIDNCRQVPMDIEERVCKGKTIIIDDVEYGENDTDTLVYRLATNCDSIVYLEVLPYPVPEISLSTIATCEGEELGRLNIKQVFGDSLLYSIDEVLEMYSDTIIQDLSVGNHTLYVHTHEGCIFPHDFEILEMPIPTLEVETSSTCVGLAEGQATLTVIADDSLYYSIDQGESYTDQLGFDSLAAGTHAIWAIDSLGCIYETEFEIIIFEEPVYDLSYVNSCEGENNGSISINLANTVNTEFMLSVDSSWVEEVSFGNLEPGEYRLYSKSEFGCIDSSDFIINTIPEPQVGFSIIEECGLHTLGSIEAVADSTLLFSIDGEEFVNEAIFDSLVAGLYTIYVQDEYFCVYEHIVDIPLLPSPDIYLDFITTCLDESMGMVEIQDLSDNRFLYSMDDSIYSEEVFYDGLPAGNYELFVQNEIGCTYFYEFEIEETLPPTVTLDYEDSCPNDDTGILQVSTSGESDIIYINAGEASNERIFDNLQPGIYEVLVEDTLGCMTFSELEIFELPPLLVNMPQLGSDCYKDEVMVRPTINSYQGNLNYSWSDGGIQDYYIAKSSGQFAVTITDDCDVVYHLWDVVVRHTATDDKLYAANIFSPNEDGVNDCFSVVVDSDLELIDFKYTIFDRWGNRMFTTTSTLDCWDGRYNSEYVVPGVYVVISNAVVLECDGIKNIRKVSDVTVFR